MANNSIYGWDETYYWDNKISGAMVDETCVKEGIFKQGVPLKECIEEGWYKRGRDILDTNPENIVKTDKVLFKNTDDWYKHQGPIQCFSSHSMAFLSHYDFISVVLAIPVVSPRVYAAMTALCPNDFEAFDIRIKAMDGVLDGYKLINITNLAFDCLDIPRSRFTGSYYEKDPKNPEGKLIRFEVSKDDLVQIYQDIAAGKQTYEAITKVPFTFTYFQLKDPIMEGCHMARLGELNWECMFSQALIDEFRRLDVKGFTYETFEEINNRSFSKPD